MFIEQLLIYPQIKTLPDVWANGIPWPALQSVPYGTEQGPSMGIM